MPRVRTNPNQPVFETVHGPTSPGRVPIRSTEEVYYVHEGIEPTPRDVLEGSHTERIAARFVPCWLLL